MGCFRKIFIANRGEIACRAIRPARELKIPVVVGYSDCDALSLHVKLADEAVRLGPSPATMSYLDIDAILRAAKDSGCDAIFPGYGFLAENPDFADAVKREKMTFIGPPARVMRIMGDKIQARKALSASGVPVTPAIEDVDDPEKVIRFGNRVGWPILVKAAGGGGGKGMQKVSSPAEVEESLATARSVAEKAFGKGTIFVEKYIEHGRHIEFQFLADRYRNVIHLGERECSIQRRHQKLVEEAPSSLLTPEIREKMGAVVVKAMRDIGYVTAGTMEFLVDREGRFYALEVNTRIQEIGRAHV
jgi:acetyl-CoA carboxylase biotin carboxylase subunit